jgi:hypothetical protein
MAVILEKPSATLTRMRHIHLVLVMVSHLNVAIDTIAPKKLLLTNLQIRMDTAQWLVFNLFHVRIMTSRCENVGRNDYYVGIVYYLHYSVDISSTFAFTLRHAP